MKLAITNTGVSAQVRRAPVAADVAADRNRSRRGYIRHEVSQHGKIHVALQTKIQPRGSRYGSGPGHGHIGFRRLKTGGIYLNDGISIGYFYGAVIAETESGDG